MKHIRLFFISLSILYFCQCFSMREEIGSSEISLRSSEDAGSSGISGEEVSPFEVGVAADEEPTFLNSSAGKFLFGANIKDFLKVFISFMEVDESSIDDDLFHSILISNRYADERLRERAVKFVIKVLSCFLSEDEKKYFINFDALVMDYEKGETVRKTPLILALDLKKYSIAQLFVENGADIFNYYSDGGIDALGYLNNKIKKSDVGSILMPDGLDADQERDFRSLSEVIVAKAEELGHGEDSRLEVLRAVCVTVRGERDSVTCI